MASKKEEFKMDVSMLRSTPTEEPAAAEIKAGVKMVELKPGYEIRKKTRSCSTTILLNPDTLAGLDALKERGHYKSRNDLINEIFDEYIERNL